MTNGMTNNALVKEYECAIDEATDLVETLIDAFDPITQTYDNVMLWGTYGIGKTSIVRQIAKRRGWKVIEFMLSIREPVDMRGIPMIDPVTKKTYWCIPAELPDAERDGEEGIFFLDEINTAPHMQAVAMKMVLDHELGDYKLPKGWRIVAAGNRIGDRAAAQRMPTALRNRFAHLFIRPDLPAWCKWANANAIAPEVVAFARLKQVIHVPFKGDENATLTPRSLVAASKYTNAPKKQRLRLLSSHIGDAYGVELDGFIDLYRTVGDLDDIIADPKGAKVYDEPSLRFAICTGLARKANRQNVEAIVTYAQRLNRESEMLLVHDATTRDAKLKETSAYGAWAVKNQDLILQMN
jgi:hypothetical protein